MSSSTMLETTNNINDEAKSPKINAFQFMMNSRHKVIGSNSPGKERKEVLESPENERNKDKLNKRKAVFEEWAEKKGGTKRKLADEAAEKHINTTLQKRAKRLKQMLAIIDEELKNSGEETSDNEEVIKVKTKKHRLPVIVSESSNDSVILNRENDKIPVEVKNNENEEKNNRIKNRVKEENVSKSFAENEQDNVIDENTSSNDSHDLIKRKSNGETDLKSPKTNNKNVKNNNKENDKCDESKTSTRINKNPKKKSQKRCFSLRKSKEEIPNTQEIKADDNQRSNKFDDLTDEDIFPKEDKQQKSPITSKKTRQLKLTNEANIQKKVENKKECFSPRTWKMRVRLVEENDTENDTKTSDDGSNINEKKTEKSKKEENIQKSESQDFEDIITIDDSFEQSVFSQESINSSESEKKPVKLAPIFMIQQQRKINKEAMDAKKNFLHSGVPSKVKKLMTKTKSFQEPEFVLSIFPKISHIQQRDTDILNIFWNLPNAVLPLKESDLEIYKLFDVIKIGTFTNCTSVNEDTIKENLYNFPSKYSNIKALVKEIKKEYPSYPVYKTFRLLYQKYEKHSKNNIKTENSLEEISPKTPTKGKKGRGRKKKPTKKADLVKPKLNTPIRLEMLTWTEKYKPQSQEEIVGNTSAVQDLKTWLESWIKYSEEQKTVRKRRRSDSSDDFCCDSTTKDSDSLPQNIVMLFGNLGSGKTSSVYGLCNELSINVIEINASSKRSGKKILADLQEATQSHQVKNTDSKSVSFFQKKPDSQTEDDINKKLSLLLFEDVDIVFDDQDDNFISALGTLITSSKRPIILTFTDKKYPHLQKFVQQYQIINFNNLSNKILNPWLQILCLIEGVRADRNTIAKFVEWNKGDVRKILLELQFWVQTGGSPQNKSKNSIFCSKMTSSNEEEISVVDENSNLSWLNEENNDVQENKDIDFCHQNCAETFIPYYERDKDGFKLSYPVNLEVLWWNVPEILGQTSINFFNNNVQDNPDNNIKTAENKSSLEELKTAANFLESLAFADLIHTKLKSECYNEPIYNYWEMNPTNSLSVDQNYSTYSENYETSLQITHWLVETNERLCQNLRGNKNVEEINTTIPYFEELGWRSKRHKCMKDLLNAVPTFSLLDRRAICEDYQTLLRAISRTENERSVTNSKRKNRFYHYFKNFNIHLNDSSFLLLCNTFSDK